MTYSEGDNSVNVLGVSSGEVLVIFADTIGRDLFNNFNAIGAFSEVASEKIFEDKNKGMLA